jgi:hypothetical protein
MYRYTDEVGSHEVSSVPERTADSDAIQPQARLLLTSSSAPVDSIPAKRDYRWTTDGVAGVNHDDFIALGGFGEVHKVTLFPIAVFIY